MCGSVCFLVCMCLCMYASIRRSIRASVNAMCVCVHVCMSACVCVCLCRYACAIVVLHQSPVNGISSLKLSSRSLQSSSVLLTNHTCSHNTHTHTRRHT